MKRLSWLIGLVDLVWLTDGSDRFLRIIRTDIDNDKYVNRMFGIRVKVYNDGKTNGYSYTWEPYRMFAKSVTVKFLIGAKTFSWVKDRKNPLEYNKRLS